MDEEIQTGANAEEVAAPQIDTQEIPNAQETGENAPATAEQGTVQSPEENAHFADMRRKQELEQYRSQAEQRQQQLETAARLQGFDSPDSYVEALQEAQREQERQEYEQAGINPDILQKFLEKTPEFQTLKQIQEEKANEQKLSTESDELFSMFPDLRAHIDQINPEVFQMREEKGISLLDAYLRTNYSSLGQQKEQEALTKLQQNAAGSPGSLGAGERPSGTGIKDMSDKDFKSFQERVLRGENVQI